MVQCCLLVCAIRYYALLLLPVCSCHRSPATANKDVCSQLTEAQQAALKKAVEMGQQFAANPTSPVIWEHLTSLVQQVNVQLCGCQHSY
jgi:hypothetical protein